MLGEKVIVHHWIHVPNEARRHCCVLDLKYRYSAEANIKSCAAVFDVIIILSQDSLVEVIHGAKV